MEAIEFIFSIVIVTFITIYMFHVMLINLGILHLPKWFTDILDEMEKRGLR